jgi:hypothetical protein
MSIDRNAVLHVGGQILSASLAALRDPSAVDDSHLDGLADLSVRAALALDAGVSRAEQRLEDEAKAAAEEKKLADRAAADAKASDVKAAADAKAAADKTAAANKAAADKATADAKAAADKTAADAKAAG